MPVLIGAFSLVAGLYADPALAESLSNKLLLTGGVSQVEGSAGGGLTPWAIIGGYGTNNEIGANVHYTYVKSQDFRLNTYGVILGIYDRFELSVAEQEFDVSDLRKKVRSGLGLDAIGRDTISQTVVGVKARLFGEAVLDQDLWLPQVAVGIQYKKNHDGDFVVDGPVVGAKSDEGVDVYVSATKLFLNTNLLLNGTLRFTKANQFGILGFGGGRDDSYQPQIELSSAYLINRKLAVGAEYRMKPSNVRSPANAALFGGAKVIDLDEDDSFDAFIAYAPTKNIALTAAYVYLGNIANVPAVKADYGTQDAVYLSAQIGF
ncbi:MAG: DUF3034 family protein [Candidatus Binatia bacterium]